MPEQTAVDPARRGTYHGKGEHFKRGWTAGPRQPGWSARPGRCIGNVATEATIARIPRRWRLPARPSRAARRLVWAGWAWWTDRRYRRAMEEIESEVTAGRYAIACRNLDRLLSWKADSNGGIAYLLGSCELARGRNQAADEAWARVVPGSAFSERAIRGRMRLLRESGQLAAAERLIRDAADDRRNDRTALLVLLVPMFSELGRIEEAARLIEDRWDHLNALGEGSTRARHQAAPAARRAHPQAHPGRGRPRRARPGGSTGSRRRSGLAGSSEPGDPDGRPRRGRALARCLPADGGRMIRRSGDRG